MAKLCTCKQMPILAVTDEAYDGNGVSGELDKLNAVYTFQVHLDHRLPSF